MSNESGKTGQDTFVFGDAGPWDVPLTLEEIVAREKAAGARTAKRLADKRREARYRLIGSATGAALLILAAVGNVVAIGYTVAGVIRWLHVPGYVALPATLWVFSYMIIKAAGVKSKRND